jgi:tetratricopeptide (TPR) repeat protein
MRISRIKRGLILPAMSVLSLAGGCAANNPQGRSALDAGETALRSGQYEQALHDADAAVAHGDADNLAEAYYLRGKVLEERQPKNDASAFNADLIAARSAYTLGLGYHPSKSLEGLLHGQLGNVCFYLDDYSAALHEWNLAYAQLTKPEWKQWLLYRIGECQQRLGRFLDADRTFESVQQTYPGTEAANRARAHQGVRGFYVQVGAFSQPGAAAAAVSAITAVGAVPMKMMEKGLTVIRTQSFSSYSQAMELKGRLAGKYPDAVILP